MMIQANELRIGNWVMDEDQTPWQIDANGILTVANGILKVEAVELTEKWLSTYGFKQNEPISSREFILSMDGVNIIKIINHYKDGWLFQFYWWNAGHMIKYVHQLQNIVYIITGQELTLNTAS